MCSERGRFRVGWRVQAIADDHVLQSTQAEGEGFSPGFAIATASPPAGQFRRQVIGFLQCQLRHRLRGFFCESLSTSISSGV